MTKYKCTYGFTEKIIEASDEDEINDFLLQDIKFCTKVEECE